MEIYLARTKNIWTEGLASPLVFHSLTPNHEDESNQTSGLDKNNDLQSGQKKQKMSHDSELIQKKRKKKKKANRVWFNGKVEQMLKFIWEYKLTCDFQGINFEPDLQSLYTKVRCCMARFNLFYLLFIYRFIQCTGQRTIGHIGHVVPY